jgi:hypothetical protein
MQSANTRHQYNEFIRVVHRLIRITSFSVFPKRAGQPFVKHSVKEGTVKKGQHTNYLRHKVSQYLESKGCKIRPSRFDEKVQLSADFVKRFFA